MKTAEKLFSSRRFHEITMDRVARQARVSKGTIYLHFRSKEDLFFETALAGFDELCRLIAAGMPEQGAFEQQLYWVCTQVSEFFEHRRPLLRLMQSEATRFEQKRGRLRERWRQQRRRLVEAVTAVVARGVEAGAVRTDLPPSVMAEYLLGMLRARVRELPEEPAAQRDLQFVVTLFLHGAATGDCGRNPERQTAGAQA